jgi:hypothetical protein
MGILDDAIREHLELKRSHGASDDEIRRKEAEAFGAARAEAQAAAAEEEHTQLLTPEHAAEPAHDEQAVAEADPLAELDPLEPAPEDPYAVHPGDELVPDPEQPHEAEHHASPAAEAGAGMLEPHQVEPGPPAPPDHHRDEQHPALVDHDHIGGEEHAPEPVFGHAAEAPTAPPDAPLDPAPVDDPPVGDPPVEHPEIDEPPPRQSPEEAGGDAEDPLEETPEFLQDAPEHDRLWFEQKPPRDFDFGE